MDVRRWSELLHVELDFQELPVGVSWSPGKDDPLARPLDFDDVACMCHEGSPCAVTLHPPFGFDNTELLGGTPQARNQPIDSGADRPFADEFGRVHGWDYTAWMPKGGTPVPRAQQARTPTSVPSRPRANAIRP